MYYNIKNPESRTRENKKKKKTKIRKLFFLEDLLANNFHLNILFTGSSRKI